ncbi:hypothetical protein HWV62_19283 [Athelia sp. TMB]|nr:hypothetical protein HWV62_19283 [Athelia sp. TMB]
MIKPLRFNAAPVLRISNHFAGRDWELDFISRSLAHSTSDEPTRFAIHGMPGLGKSQLALQYSKLGYSSRKYACIFWISATIEEKIIQGLISILDLVDDKDRHHPDHAVRLMAARRWLEKSPHAWLLILDDVTANAIPCLREHLPRENIGGAIIITTRTSQVAEAAVKVDEQRRCILELKPLSTEKSVMLLMRAAGLADRGDGSEEIAKKLVRRIGCLPLAVEQAGAYMKKKHIPTEELQTLYDRSSLVNVITWENTLSNYETRSVLAAFSIPLQNLRQVSPNTSNLLSVLVYFDPESIPFDFLAHGAELARSRLVKSSSSPVQEPTVAFGRTTASPPRKRRKLLIPVNRQGPANAFASDGGLSQPFNMESILEHICSKQLLRESMIIFEEYSLAQPVYDDNMSVHIHDLIQLVVLEQGTAADQSEEYHDVAVTLLTSAFKRITDIRLPQSWAECERFVPHLMSLEKHRPAKTPPSKEFMDMSQEIAKYFHQRGRYNEAEALLNRVLAQREQAAGIGEHHLDTLGTVNTLAEVYMARGKYDKAEEFFGRALAGRKNQIGADHRDTLDTLYRLAYLRVLQHRYDDAEELYARLLEKREVQFAAEHLDTLGAVNGLAFVYHRQGKLDDAMPFYKRVLAGHENQRGSEHPDTLVAMANLGELYREQGKYDEAEPLLARVLRSRETQLGKEHPDALDVGHKLARLYFDQGKYDEAETLYARVLAGEDKQLGAEHPETLATVHNFAVLRERQGRWEEAEELFRRALAGFEKVRGREHGDTGQAVNNFAYLYQRQGRDEEAEKLRARFREVGQQA